MDRDTLSFFESRRARTGPDGNFAQQNLNRRAVAERVDTKLTALRNRDIEGRCNHAERVFSCEAGVKRSGALSQIELGNAAAAGEGQLFELKDGIFGQICRGAVFELNFSEPGLGREGISLLQGQIHQGLFPAIAARMRDEHLAVRPAQTDHSRIIGILRLRDRRGKNKARRGHQTQSDNPWTLHSGPNSGRPVNLDVRCRDQAPRLRIPESMLSRLWWGVKRMDGELSGFSV